MNNANWTFKNGAQFQNCSSFPFAYKMAYNLIRNANDAKQNVAALMKNISIVGPPNLKGDRKVYSYTAATAFAREMGLISGDGTGSLNKKEFKNL